MASKNRSYIKVIRRSENLIIAAAGIISMLYQSVQGKPQECFTFYLAERKQLWKRMFVVVEG